MQYPRNQDVASLLQGIVPRAQIAFHLTHKQGIFHTTDRGTSYESLTTDTLSADIARILHLLNSRFLKSAYKRFKRRIGSAVVIEGGEGTDKRIHTHGILQIPGHFLHTSSGYDLVHEEISNAYNASRFRHSRIEIAPHTGDGFYSYISKQGIDSVDLRNTHKASFNGA